MHTCRFGAVAVTLAVLLLVGVAGAEDKDEAKARFEKGVALYNSADFGAALVEFRAAYAAMPHFAVRYNIGITLYELHRYAEAMDEFLAFLEEGGEEIDPDRKAEVEALVKDLDSYVAIAKITCNVPGAKLFVNGTFKTALTGLDTMALDVGEYNLEISAKDHETHYAHIEVPGGQVIFLDISLEAIEAPVVPPPPEPVIIVQPPPPVQLPVKDPRKPARVAFDVFMGLTITSGGLLAVAGTVFLKTKKKYESRDWYMDWEQDKRTMKSTALAADILWGITGTFGLIVVITGILGYRKLHAEDPAKVTLSPWLHQPGLTLSGTF